MTPALPLSVTPAQLVPVDFCNTASLKPALATEASHTKRSVPLNKIAFYTVFEA